MSARACGKCGGEGWIEGVGDCLACHGTGFVGGPTRKIYVRPRIRRAPLHPEGNPFFDEVRKRFDIPGRLSP